MPIPQQELYDILANSFADGEVIVRDTVGDQDHYEVSVKSKQFAGLSRIAQHQLVMKALGGQVGTRIHALSIKTEAV